MDSNGEGFLEWARDGARTLEERYGIFVVTEKVYRMFPHGEGVRAPDFEKERREREARKFNPAYEPAVDGMKLEFTAGKAAGLAGLALGDYQEDRPLRDVSFLRFFPALVSLRVSYLDRGDLEGVQHLKGLETFFLWSDEVEDYGALAACKGLREMEVYTRHPWPVLEGLAGLEKLEVLKWHGKISALGCVGSLPALRHLYTGGDAFNGKTGESVRDLHSLPEMPLLEHLWGGWFYRLDGIGRYPLLRFLAVLTHAKSLAALSCLRQLTHLRVSAPRLEGLQDVAGMEGLLQFALCSELPQDWGVVMENDSLREVWHFIDFETEADLGMLRVMLPDYDAVFSAPEARPPGPLRIFVNGSVDDKYPRNTAPPPDFPAGEAGWHGNLGMRESERKWVLETLREALRVSGYLNLQGVRADGAEAANVFKLLSFGPSPFANRRIDLRLLGTEAISHLPGIIGCLRTALSKMRNRWQIQLSTDPEPDADDWDADWRGEGELSDEELEKLNEQDREIEKKRERILLEDKLRARMLGELGEGLEGFRPSPRPERPGSIPAAETDGEDGGDEEEEDGHDFPGGIAEYDEARAEKDEHWLEPVEDLDPNGDWNDLRCGVVFDEDGLYLHAKDSSIDALCELLDVEPEYGE